MPSNLVRLVREPLNSGEAAPLLILLHGLGSHEEDLMGLAPELSPEIRVVTLRAPHPYSAGGFAWFELQWDAAGIRIDPLHVLKSLNLLIEEIESLQTEFAPSKLLLGGFSQGAIMTLGATIRRPDLFDGALCLSGRFMPELFAVANEGIAKVPFLVQHGLYDSVLPVEGAREIHENLLKLGVDVEYHEYPMAHEVSWQSLSDAKNWLLQIIR